MTLCSSSVCVCNVHLLESRLEPALFKIILFYMVISKMAV